VIRKTINVPMKTPTINGSVLKNPAFALDADEKILFGPGVKIETNI
jgi:hypothetical protein